MAGFFSTASRMPRWMRNPQIRQYGCMKTTIELPDPLVRKANATAAERGQSFNAFVTDALRDKLALVIGRPHTGERAWMEGFGKLKHLHEETVRVQSVIDE